MQVMTLLFGLGSLLIVIFGRSGANDSVIFLLGTGEVCI
jgi:hypothetical protein